MGKLFSTIRVAVLIVVWPLLIHAISGAGPLQAGEYAHGVLTAGARTNSAIGATVIHQIPSPDTYSAGLAWDGQSLWNCGAFTSMMYELDPSDGTVLTSYNTGIPDLRGLAFGDDHLWVSSWITETIYELVPADGTIVHSFPAPFAGKPDGLAWDNGVLWIAEEDGLIYRVDSDSGQVLSSIPPPPGCCSNPRGLAWDATNLWAGYQSVGLIYKLDPADGSVRDVLDSPSGPFQQGLTFDGRFLWSTGGDNVIYQLNVGCQASIQVRGDVHTPGSKLPIRVHIAHNRPETVTVPWEMTLIDAQGRVVAKHTTQPHTFQPGDVVDKDVEFRLPVDLASGTYTVRLAIRGMAGMKGATTSFQVVRAE